MSTLPEIFDRFNSLRVLIIGDVMIDSYLWGKVDRISPEAPVPIVNVQKRESRLGGAANVALNVQALGAAPILCSIVGKDEDGKKLMDLLSEKNLSTEGILQSEERITTIKHRIISGSHQMLRVDQEMDSEINTKDNTDLLHRISELLPSCDVVIFEDYDKGILSQGLISKVIELCLLHKIPTTVDPKKRNFLHYKKATLFKPNRKELKEGLKSDLDLSKIENIALATEQLKQSLAVNQILITLSEQGIFYTNGQTQLHYPAHLRNISDVSGAGDTVISTASLCLALGLPASQITQLANLAGGLVCEEIGVVPISKDKLLSEAIRLGL